MKFMADRINALPSSDSALATTQTVTIPLIKETSKELKIAVHKMVLHGTFSFS